MAHRPRAPGTRDCSSPSPAARLHRGGGYDRRSVEPSPGVARHGARRSPAALRAARGGDGDPEAGGPAGGPRAPARASPRSSSPACRRGSPSTCPAAAVAARHPRATSASWRARCRPAHQLYKGLPGIHVSVRNPSEEEARALGGGAGLPLETTIVQTHTPDRPFIFDSLKNYLQKSGPAGLLGHPPDLHGAAAVGADRGARRRRRRRAAGRATASSRSSASPPGSGCGGSSTRSSPC